MTERTHPSPSVHTRPRRSRRAGRAVERRALEQPRTDDVSAQTSGAGVAEPSLMTASREVVEPLTSEALFDAPTEPRNTLPTYPDAEWYPEVEWELPTVPDGQMLDQLDPDERD